ncbi:MAG: hypothetical protein OEL81_00260 [Nitrosopumilus sp.]|nr:hypothetical protein [Nitrosopumilus sp.]
MNSKEVRYQVDHRMKKRLWKYELIISICIIIIAISLVFIIMMRVNITTGFKSTIDPYETLVIASIVLVVSLIVIPVVWLRYRTLYNEPLNWFTKQQATGTRVKKRCTVCNKHPVSKGYHLKHVHQLENVKRRDYFEDCGCEMCQNLGGWIEEIYHLLNRDR